MSRFSGSSENFLWTFWSMLKHLVSQANIPREKSIPSPWKILIHAVMSQHKLKGWSAQGNFILCHTASISLTLYSFSLFFFSLSIFITPREEHTCNRQTYEGI